MVVYILTRLYCYMSEDCEHIPMLYIEGLVRRLWRWTRRRRARVRGDRRRARVRACVTRLDAIVVSLFISALDEA